MKRSLWFLVWLAMFVPVAANAQTLFAVHPNTFKVGEQSTVLVSLQFQSPLAAGTLHVVELIPGGEITIIPITGAGLILSEGVVSTLFKTEIIDPGMLFITALAPIPTGRYSLEVQFVAPTASRLARVTVSGPAGPPVVLNSPLLAFVEFDFAPPGPPGPAGATGATGPQGPAGPSGTGIPTGTIVLLAKGAPAPGPGFTFIGTIIGFQAWKKD